MTDTLYRWVKAINKPLPSPYGTDGKLSVRYKGKADIIKFNGTKWVWDIIGVNLSDKHLEDIEWLEPYTPSPVSGSLAKDQIKAWLDEYVSPDGMPGDFTPSEVVAILQKFQSIPTPGDNQSLEEAAEKYSDKIVPHKELIIERTKCENIWTDVYDAFLAGAGYSKGGEGLVDELRKANPYRGNDRNAYEQAKDLSWSNCCQALQELLNQSK